MDHWCGRCDSRRCRGVGLRSIPQDTPYLFEHTPHDVVHQNIPDHTHVDSEVYRHAAGIRCAKIACECQRGDGDHYRAQNHEHVPTGDPTGIGLRHVQSGIFLLGPPTIQSANRRFCPMEKCPVLWVIIDLHIPTIPDRELGRRRLCVVGIYSPPPIWEYPTASG